MARGSGTLKAASDATTTGWTLTGGSSFANALESSDGATSFVSSPINGTGTNLVLGHTGTPSDFGSMWIGGIGASNRAMRISAGRRSWVDDNNSIQVAINPGGYQLVLGQWSAFANPGYSDLDASHSQTIPHANFRTDNKATWDAAQLTFDVNTTTTMTFDGWYYDISYFEYNFEYIKSTSQAPIVMAPGAYAAVTTGTCTVVLPSHQANDILVVCASFWGPATASAITSPTPPSGWNVLTQAVTSDGDGWHGIYWKRATSSAETNPVLARGTTPTWDTGTDTAYGGVAYVVRGCITTGDPWDHVNVGSLYASGGNSIAFLGATVNGPERTLSHMTLHHGANNGRTNDDPAFKMVSFGTVSNTTGTDLSMELHHLRDEDATVPAPSGAFGGGFGGPAVGWGQRVCVSWKPPPPPVPLFKGLVLPRNQAVRRAANW